MGKTIAQKIFDTHLVDRPFGEACAPRLAELTESYWQAPESKEDANA